MWNSMVPWIENVGFIQKILISGHDSAILTLIGLNYYMGALCSWDYYVFIGHKKAKLLCLFSIFNLLATFGGKTGVAISNGLGPPDLA